MYTWVVSNFIINVLGLQDQIWTIFFSAINLLGDNRISTPTSLQSDKNGVKKAQVSQLFPTLCFHF